MTSRCKANLNAIEAIVDAIQNHVPHKISDISDDILARKILNALSPFMNTRAVPELVRYRLHWYDFDIADMEVDSLEGEYVRYDQAAEIIATEQQKTKAAEAKLDQIKAQEPVAWMYVNGDEECEQIEYGEPFNDPHITPLYAAPVDQTAEIESITSYAKQLIAAFDEDNDLDNPEKFNAYHNLKSALSRKEPL